MRVMSAIGRPEITAPKTLRHTFATTLQDANVDPLVRNDRNPSRLGVAISAKLIFARRTISITQGACVTPTFCRSLPKSKPR